MKIFNDWGERIESYFTNFPEKIQEIFSNPSSLIGLLGLLIILFILLKLKKVKLDAKIIARIGIAIAISCILQVLRIYHFPMGGSVTLGGMVPLLIIAFIYGPEIGMFAGFTYTLYIQYKFFLIIHYPL